jgi:hypothetical protein
VVALHPPITDLPIEEFSASDLLGDESTAAYVRTNSPFRVDILTRPCDAFRL